MQERGKSKKNKKKSVNNKKKKTNQHRRKALLFIFNILFYLITFGIILGSGLFALTQKNDESLNGYRIFGVLTNSMVSPGNKIKDGGFRAGDILIVKEIPEKDVKIGDVITYHPSLDPVNKSNNYLTHRVVEKLNELGGEEGNFLVTRGDANKTNDMPVSAEQLVGKEVFVIPKIGGILSFVKENVVTSIIFISCIWGFIFIVRVYIFGNRNNIKKNSTKKKTKKKHQKKL